ncbi:hypothetical protein KFE25_006702 [Diacronema lutheri]|uniref:CBS domain-containing protein n=1 Tax=Diacronema lutheri TaxID=2081491 RepID=A0A8J5XY79_DIALT|nr:hypothetical protein KFE25_006702 [Diacronema lutheri]
MSCRRLSTMPFAKSFYDPRTAGVPAFVRDDTWAFTPLANVLMATGKSGSCDRMPSFRGREDKRYVISDKASILEACKQMVHERLSFLVVVRPSIALGPKGNTVIGVATEHKYVQHGARKIEDVGDAERSAFLSGWSLSDSIYEIMTPTDRMIAVTQFDTVQHCVDLLEKKLFRYLPIVSPDDGSLRGILTVRDLLRPNSKPWGPIAHLWDGKPVEEILQESAGGADGMRALVEICSISQSRMVADAVVQMARHSLNFLIVVDEANGGDVQGVITERHYVTYGSKVSEREASRTNSTTDGLASIMTPRSEMLVAPAGMDGSRCLDVMLENNVRFMPVTNAERTKFLGVLSLRDFLLPLWK